jgi:hypothetical protein
MAKKESHYSPAETGRASVLEREVTRARVAKP